MFNLAIVANGANVGQKLKAKVTYPDQCNNFTTLCPNMFNFVYTILKLKELHLTLQTALANTSLLLIPYTIIDHGFTASDQVFG